MTHRLPIEVKTVQQNITCLRRIKTTAVAANKVWHICKDHLLMSHYSRKKTAEKKTTF